MTSLLERAFAEAAKRPAAEQELLASRLLAELADEDDFDRAIAGASDKLARLAAEARASAHLSVSIRGLRESPSTNNGESEGFAVMQGMLWKHSVCHSSRPPPRTDARDQSLSWVSA